MSVPPSSPYLSVSVSVWDNYGVDAIKSENYETPCIACILLLLFWLSKDFDLFSPILCLNLCAV